VKDVVVVSGASGSGKTTIVRQVAEKDRRVHLSVSFTTRPQGEREKDGVDYHFVSEEVFRRMIGEDKFLEWAEVGPYLYGTPWPTFDIMADKTLVLEIDCQGAEQVRKKYPTAKSVFIHASEKNREARMRARGRGESDEDIARRLERGLVEVAQKDKFDFWILNDDLDDAVNSFSMLVDLLHRGLAPNATFRNPAVFYEEPVFRSLIRSYQVSPRVGV
jgi:guanylate kinase